MWLCSKCCSIDVPQNLLRNENVVQPSPSSDQPAEQRVRSGVAVPAESATLDQAWRRSGLTHSELAIATGMSVGAVRVALAGVRYRAGSGEAFAVVPRDEPLAKLASVLGVDPRVLSLLGRDRAAQMVTSAATEEIDLEAPAAVAGRRALAKQVLAAFSTAELRAEIERRDAEIPEP